MRILIIISVICIGTSCSPLKPVLNNDVENIDTYNLNQLNGDYQIFSTDSSSLTLPSALLLDNRHNFWNLPDSDDWINLKLIDSTRIEISLYDNGIMVKKKVRKGKLENNYFEFKRAVKMKFWFILNGFNENKTRIGLGRNGDLIVDEIGGGVAFLILIPVGGADNSFYGVRFKSKK
jgi:hypothetical protein